MEVLQFLTGTFSRRFFLNALLPTFIFVGIVGIVSLSYNPGLDTAIATWSDLPITNQLLSVFLYLSAVYFLSAAVASQWRGIVRIFEGYPADAFFERFDIPTPGRAWHRAQRMRLITDARRQAVAYYSYTGRQLPRQGKPPNYAGRVMPTRLGNILLAGERYSNTRYGIDGIIFWPRLYPLLPDAFRKDYEEFLINHEFPLVVAFESALTTVITSLLVLFFHGEPLAFCASVFIGSTFTYGAYALSLASATELAEQQRVAFDLYRDRLLIAWPALGEVTDEGRAFLSIQNFVVKGTREDSWDDPQNSFLIARRRRKDQGPE